MVDELALLRDIHVPASVGFWPMALGWWLILILTATIAGIMRPYYLKGAYKRQALKLLDEYQQQYQKHKNTILISQQINELLKRVALMYFPKAEVAALKGQAWINFLNKYGKNIDFNPVAFYLLELPYQSTNVNTTSNIKPLISRAAVWIRQRGTPCLD